MEAYFIINEFEEGYHLEEFVYEEVVQEYVEDVLQVPSEYITSLNYNGDQLEIVLNEIDHETSKEDWFVNLERLNVA